MSRALKIIIPIVLIIALAAILLFGYQQIQVRDAAMARVISVVKGLDSVSNRLVVLNGGVAQNLVEWVPGETYEPRRLGVTNPNLVLAGAPDETAEPTETPAETAAANNTTVATARPTSNTSSTTSTTTRTTPRPTSAPTQTTPPAPADTTAPVETDVPPVVTDPPVETEAPPVDITPVPVTDPPHEHTWVTETIPESGHYETQWTGSTTVTVGYTTVTDVEGYTDEDGNWHDAITHQEPITETQDIYENVWVVDSPASSRTYCSVCGAAG